MLGTATLFPVKIFTWLTWWTNYISETMIMKWELGSGTEMGYFQNSPKQFNSQVRPGIFLQQNNDILNLSINRTCHKSLFDFSPLHSEGKMHLSSSPSRTRNWLTRPRSSLHRSIINPYCTDSKMRQARNFFGGMYSRSPPNPRRTWDGPVRGPTKNRPI